MKENKLFKRLVIFAIAVFMCLSTVSTVSAATGDDCSDPIIVAIPAGATNPGDIIYTDLGQTTCGRGDDYDDTDMGSYDNGEDIIYRLDVSTDTPVVITVSNMGTNWAGVGLFTDCPDVGSLVIKDTYGDPLTITTVLAAASSPYYLMVDSWPSPDCIDFDLTIEMDAGPGPGEDCTTAIPVGMGTHFCPGPEYWYEYTATGGTITITSCYAGQEVDTTLYVYDACGGTLIAENDDCYCPEYNYASTVVFTGTAGVSYKIFWDDYWTYDEFYWILGEDIGGMHDVGVTAINSPAQLDDAGTLPVEIQVENFGDYDETDVPVHVVITSGAAGGNLLWQDFELAFPPTGWTNIVNVGHGWERNDYWGRLNYAGGTGYCADADSDAYGTAMDTELWSPTIDLSGYPTATLEFDAAFNAFGGDYADCDISTNGGSTWTNLMHWTTDHDAYGPGEHMTFDLTPYVGSSNVVVRFHYVCDGWDYYYEVDNVQVTVPTTVITEYDETVLVDILSEESKAVSLPTWTAAIGSYEIEACTELVDEVPSNDCIEIDDLLIGDLDVGVDSIDIPHALMGPVAFNPTATVQNYGDLEVDNAPIHCIIEGPGSELKFSEDFESIAGLNTVEGAKGIVESGRCQKEGFAEASGKIFWEDDPNLDAVSDWTVLDVNGDGTTWHQTDYRSSSPTHSMYNGDESTKYYKSYSKDWLISPQIHVGAQGTWEFDLWMHCEGSYWDNMYFGNSADGNSWNFWWFGGWGGPTGGFMHVSVPLFDSQIDAGGNTYVGFYFSSDSIFNYEGCYVDNVDVYGAKTVYDEMIYGDFDVGEVKQLAFPEFTPDDDIDYFISICSELQDDEDPTNDCQTLSFNTGAPVYNTRTGYGYTTIQAAIDDVDTLDGDTIIARDGNYNEDINIYKDLTVTGKNPPTSTSIIYGTVDIVADGVTFQNFKVIPGGLYTANEAGIFIAANDVIVQDNIIEGMTGEVADTMFTVKGIHVYGHPDALSGIVIQNNIIRNIVNTNQTGGGGGGSWTFLKNYNLPGLSPAPEAWHSDIIDLSAYDGQTIQLAFQYVSDNEWAAYYDDISVQDGSSTYFSENFDSYPNDYTFDGTAACGFWNQENYGAACGSTYHYIMVEDYKSHSAPYSAEAYYNCPNDDWLITPDIDCTGSSGLYLDFWYLWDNSWDIEFNVYVMSGGGPTTYTYGGADGIMIQGLVSVDVLDNEIYDIHSAGWCYGVEVTPTASTAFDGSFADTLIDESFEGVGLPTGWTSIDNDGDGYDWDCDWVYPYTGSECAASASYINGVGALNPDNYLITPQLDLSSYGSAELSFWTAAQDPAWPSDHLEIWVSTSGNGVSDFTDMILEFVETDDTWKQHILDLSAYAGDNIYIAFVHNECTDWYWIRVDDVQVTAEAGSGGSGQVNVIGNYFTQIGDDSVYDVWDNPMIAPYPGVMFTIDESYPGADDGDATAVELHKNIFDNDCVIPVLAVVNKDTDGLLDAEMNYWGNILGPGSYGAPVYDAITGDLADADDFSCSIVASGPVHFTPFVGVDAVATASSLYVETGETVIFNAAGSFAADFDGVYVPVYYWSFGDGFHSVEEQVGHSYGSPGAYDVYVRVQGQGLGDYWPNFMYDWAHLTITVTSPSAPLDANADGGNLGGYETIVGEEVQLFGSATGGEPRYTYSWDLDNGLTSSERNPTTVYEFEGTYTVTLTVTDSEGNIATDMAQVNVLARDELIASAGGPYNGVPSVPVNFISDVIGGTGPYTYAWDLGDGTVSDLASPVHTYDEAGAYTITLTVEDSLGEIDTDTTIVTVEQEEDDAIIGEIQGGLGIKTTITAGSEPVDWTINVDGRVFMGGSASGSISAGSTEAVRLPFSLGIGNVDITITANSITKECTAFMIGPFVLIK